MTSASLQASYPWQRESFVKKLIVNMRKLVKGNQYTNVVELDPIKMSLERVLTVPFDGYHFLSSFNVAKATTVLQLMDSMAGADMRFDTNYSVNVSLLVEYPQIGKVWTLRTPLTITTPRNATRNASI
jgi:hypothetical protein